MGFFQRVIKSGGAEKRRHFGLKTANTSRFKRAAPKPPGGERSENWDTNDTNDEQDSHSFANT
jgi:hypothetical protein